MLKANQTFTHNGRYFAKGDDVPEDIFEPDDLADRLSREVVIDPKKAKPKSTTKSKAGSKAKAPADKG